MCLKIWTNPHFFLFLTFLLFTFSFKLSLIHSRINTFVSRSFYPYPIGHSIKSRTTFPNRSKSFFQKQQNRKRVGLVDDATYGLINAVSYAANAFSKPLSGVMLDTLKSPKFTFIAMMMTTIVLALMNTVLVAPWNFVMFFAAIKFLSAFGKPGVLKIASQWWPFEAMGRISGLMTGGG